MKMKIAALALLALAGAANAQTVTYSGTVTQQFTNWNFPSLSLPQWDPAAFGVNASDLTSIVLTISGNVAGTIVITNNDPTGSALIDYALQSNITFTAPNGLTVLTIPAASGSTTLNAGQTFSSGPLAASNSNAANVPSAQFGSYIGNGTFPVGVRALGTSFASGAGNQSNDFTSEAGATYSVTYNWIPTPGAAAAFALAGLAAGRRRR